MKNKLLCLLMFVCCPFSGFADRPNIIVILSDDMGYSDIGCYGGEIDTPVLDGLAKKGVRFTQFYNTGRCCPTRASLLTGLYPHQAGVGHMLQDKKLRGYSTGLNDRCRTMAEVLRSAGYATFMSGKWHVTKDIAPQGAQGKKNWPIQRGFDRFFGTIHGAGSFYDPNTLTRDNDYIVPEKGFYYTDAISDNAAQYIRERDRKKPFFMYVTYTAAHWPMHAKPEDIAKYKGRYDAGYAAIRTARHARMKELGLVPEDSALSAQAEKWREDEPYRAWEIRCMEVYGAMVDSMDQGIGRIMTALDETDARKNTVVLFMQDNGGCAEGYGRRKAKKSLAAEPDKIIPMGPEELQTLMRPKRTRDGRPIYEGIGVMPGPADSDVGYGRGWANVSNTPFREYKHWVHEGGISTPLIVHWPAGITAKRNGTMERQPGHLIDVMATCVDLAGASYPAKIGGRDITPLEGVSLVPGFHGKPMGRTAPILFEHEGNRALRDGKWKLVAKGAVGPWELYDIDADRSEQHDLGQKHPQRLADMVAQWESMAHTADIIPWPWKGPYGKK